GTYPRAARWKRARRSVPSWRSFESSRCSSATLAHGRDLRAAAKGDGGTKRSIRDDIVKRRNESPKPPSPGDYVGVLDHRRRRPARQWRSCGVCRARTGRNPACPESHRTTHNECEWSRAVGATASTRGDHVGLTDEGLRERLDIQRGPMSACATTPSRTEYLEPSPSLRGGAAGWRRPCADSSCQSAGTFQLKAER